MPYESPYMSRRVQDQFGGLDFGGGEGSLDNWRMMARRQDAQQGGGGLQDFYSSLNKAYGDTPALSAYRQHLGNAPQAEDYRPGVWDRIASGLGGFSAGLKDAGAGVALAQKMNRSKYDTALSDYYNQAAPLKEAAGIEREGISDRVKSLIDAQEARQKYLDYTRNLDKDYNDWLIASGNLDVNRGKLGLDRDKFGYEKLSGDRDYNLDVQELNSLNAYRGGQLGIEGMNARTRAADVNSLIGRRADQTFFDNMGLYGGGKAPSAGDIGKAEQDVMADVAVQYPSVITYDPMQQTYGFTAPPPVGTPDYATYQAVREEVENRANARARTGQVTFSDYGAAGGGPMNFGGNYNPNPPPSLPNFGPSQSERRGGKYTRER